MAGTGEFLKRDEVSEAQDVRHGDGVYFTDRPVDPPADAVLIKHRDADGRVVAFGWVIPELAQGAAEYALSWHRSCVNGHRSSLTLLR